MSLLIVLCNPCEKPFQIDQSVLERLGPHNVVVKIRFNASSPRTNEETAMDVCKSCAILRILAPTVPPPMMLNGWLINSSATFSPNVSASGLSEGTDCSASNWALPMVDGWKPATWTARFLARVFKSPALLSSFRFAERETREPMRPGERMRNSSGWKMKSFACLDERTFRRWNGERIRQKPSSEIS